MKAKAAALDRVREDARVADELHERSRALLVDAVRAGARAGLSQRQIAAAAGRSQPEISRLLRFRGVSPLGRRVTRHRDRILETLAAHGIRNVRVFGSVARGEEGEGSDVDFLVELPAEVSLFELARVEDELGNLLGAEVDIVSARGLRAHLSDRVSAEAVPL